MPPLSMAAWAFFTLFGNAPVGYTTEMAGPLAAEADNAKNEANIKTTAPNTVRVIISPISCPADPVPNA
jgi:hypothetical protein